MSLPFADRILPSPNLRQSQIPLMNLGILRLRFTTLLRRMVKG